MPQFSAVAGLTWLESPGVVRAGEISSVYGRIEEFKRKRLKLRGKMGFSVAFSVYVVLFLYCPPHPGPVCTFSIKTKPTKKETQQRQRQQREQNRAGKEGKYCKGSTDLKISLSS